MCRFASLVILPLQFCDVLPDYIVLGRHTSSYIFYLGLISPLNEEKTHFKKKMPHSKLGVRKDWFSISRQGKQSCSRCWNRKRSSVIFCFLIALIPRYSTWLSSELRAATGLKILAAFLSHTGHMFTQCSCGFPPTVQTYRSHESDTLYF